MKYLKQSAFLLFIVSVILINVSIIYGSSMSASCGDDCTGIMTSCTYDENNQITHIECQYVDGGTDSCAPCLTPTDEK